MIVALIALTACCVDGDGVTIPDGVEETATCRSAAADAHLLVAARRRLGTTKRTNFDWADPMIFEVVPRTTVEYSG